MHLNKLINVLLYLESGDRLSINEIGIFILLGLWGLSAGVLTCRTICCI